MGTYVSEEHTASNSGW